LNEIIIDLFAGGGGASTGIEAALGRPVDIAINHDFEAIQMHKANHPDSEHHIEDVFAVNPYKAVNGRSVGLLWASPDCKHFSRAKGGKPVEKKTRGLAWVVIKWAKAVNPRVIMLENVPEFKNWGPLDKDNKPIKSKKGMTFNLWANQLRGLGYDVQFKELVACDYGTPTIRKRLFMIARCDGQPIVWPEPTHSEPGNLSGLKPYRTAAECIDWSLPCPSIFERKKPLAENTLRRIARGLQKYVIESSNPYLVTVGYGERKGQAPRTMSLEKPLGTIVSTSKHALVMPHLTKYHGLKGNEVRGQKVSEPIRVIDTQNRHGVVMAFLSKYYTGVVGSKMKEPMPTVTAIDHNALIATHLTKFYGTNIGSDMRRPVPTVTATGQHIGEVRAFLIKYYGCGVGQGLNEPAHTVTSKDRFGLVTVAGQKYQIADIGLRMLQPRELARAQGFPDSYVLTGTKSNKVAKIGNSVCPPIAKALVGANVELIESKKVHVG